MLMMWHSKQSRVVNAAISFLSHFGTVAFSFEISLSRTLSILFLFPSQLYRLFSLVLLQLSAPIMTTDTAMISIRIRSPGHWTLRLVDRSRSHLISSILSGQPDCSFQFFSETKIPRGPLLRSFLRYEISSCSWIQFIQLAMFHAIP